MVVIFLKNSVKEFVFFGLFGVGIFDLGVVGVDDDLIGFDVGDVMVLLGVKIFFVWGDVICIVVEVFGNIIVCVILFIM